MAERTIIDTRIKAVATTSMYDLSRSIGKGMMDSYTEAQNAAIIANKKGNDDQQLQV